MKKEKILSLKRFLTILSLLLVSFSSFVLSACDFSDILGQMLHTHTYATEWSYDYDYHWHELTCEHKGTVDNREKHSYNEDFVCAKCGYAKSSNDLSYSVSYPENKSNAIAEEKNGYITVSVGTCEDEEIFIPSQLTFVPDGQDTPITLFVTRIENEGFKNSSAKKIYLPKTIYHIGDGAFKDSENLNEIIFTNGKKSILKTVGEGVFSGCENLTEILFPENAVVNKNAYIGSSILFNLKIEVIPQGCCEISGSGDYKFNHEISLSAKAVTDYSLDGWYVGDNKISSDANTVFTLTENTTVTAKYKTKKLLTVIIDGVTLTEDIFTGDLLDSNIPNSAINRSGRFPSGYIADWYLDEEFTIPLKSTEITEDITVYGNKSYIVNNLLFYDYIDTFDKAIKTVSLSVKSRDMLIAYMDYAVFYDIDKQVKLYLNYDYEGTVSDEINSVYNLWDKKFTFYDEFPTSAFSHGYSSDYAFFYTTNPVTHNFSTKVADELKQSVYTQQESVSPLSYPNAREENYDDFAVNELNRNVRVTTSDQLTYALEQGFNPVCESGSNAETVYNKAKIVLRKIISDDMDDTEKVRRIYEYIIINNNYDKKAYNIASNINWREYDAWFAEGVFNNGVAVCDGISKAFLIMAEIEGIPCVRVTGNSHAWNRVYIDGDNNGILEWYGVDATHGDLGFSNGDSHYEVLTYTAFLFTDSYKSGKGYSSSDYKEFKATTVYNPYENFKFGEEENAFDLHIDSQQEFVNALNYLKDFSATTDYKTIEIAINSEDDFTKYQTYYQNNFGKFTSTKSLKNSSNQSVYIILMKTAE